MKNDSMFVGMDVHQKSIDITVAEAGHDGKVWHFGCIGGDLKALDKAVDKLLEAGRPLHVVYEAGPSGYVIYRHLQGRGLPCTVVAPAQVPKKASDRIKTDRRDSQKLAVQHRAGALRAIYVPEPADEAMRDLVRAREDAVEARRRARQHLNSFLLRHGRRYGGKTKWSTAHRGWLAEQRFEHSAQRVTLEEYLGTIAEAEQRVERVSQQIRPLLPTWRWHPYVEALQALRGVSWIVATTVVAEVGDLRRFRPRELMGFLGMVPSEYSSGDTKRRGAITKSGNAHVRRVLCEAAWAYAQRPAISRELLKRQQDLPQEIRALAWKAQLRLCARCAHLSAARKHRNKINTAIARELTGFMWANAGAVGKPATANASVRGRATAKSGAPAQYVLRRQPRPARQRAAA